jgi:hypothetical protein
VELEAVVEASGVRAVAEGPLDRVETPHGIEEVIRVVFGLGLVGVVDPEAEPQQQDVQQPGRDLLGRHDGPGGAPDYQVARRVLGGE